ncbi:2Fe-2S iron-sulfur cluster-binding protein [Gordonia sp. PS3]|uniref:2Fe-2S iron-sulfur cluster-binding protein n=1 Tax=Gordonia sp. PS3 TaxID=3248841 RepID=UPI0035BEE9C3
MAVVDHAHGTLTQLWTELLGHTPILLAETRNGTQGASDCGGEAACGTCHVIVDPQWSEQVGLSGPEEEEMLAMNPERQPTSRLSCQMAASAAWDGLIVELPEFQM